LRAPCGRPSLLLGGGRLMIATERVLAQQVSVGTERA
jgi:hypothetical protein